MVFLYQSYFLSRGGYMKKSSTIVGSMLAVLGGYGAWCMYKKMNPGCARKVKNDMKQMTRNMEKSIEDMM